MSEELRVVELYPGLFVREDGMLKKTTNNKWFPGSDKGNGYFHTPLPKSKKYIAVHRLVAMAFIDNKEGFDIVDHIDGDTRNNNVNNLRWVNKRTNNINTKRNRNGKLFGCRFYPKNKTNPWQARVKVSGVEISVGYYRTELEAHEAYKEKLSELGLLIQL